MNRRHFLMSGAAAATVLKSSSLASPNGAIRVAVVGTRGQGNSHIGQYSRMKDVQIAALVDVDENILDQRLKQIESRGLPKPDRYVDIRKMLEDKSIDCVSIATPNHSHTMQAVWSMQAGKHVYVEKPCSHNIFESQQIVKAARKYDKLVQHGSNSRSNPGLIEAVEQLEKGVIGEVYYSKGLCYKWRDTIGHTPDEAAPPPGVHYDEWLGPAPKRPFSKNRFHYNWHWNWDYGNGDFGNQGIHELDICRWGLGVTYPVKVSAIGGKYMFDDDQNTPNTVVISYDFLKPNGKNALMVFEVRHWITNPEAGIGVPRNNPNSPVGNPVGNVFYGSNGYMAIEGYASYKTFIGRKGEPGPAKTEGYSNWQNFIDAVRAGKREVLNAEIEKGAISCTLMHLGNIAYRLGRTLYFDEKTMSVKGDAEANKMFTRAYRAPYVVPAKV